jgi:hypothetical protein
MKRQAILDVSKEFFANLLQLPDGVQVTDVRVAFETGTVQIKVSGAGWTDDPILHTSGTVTRQDDGTVTFNWDLPA